jgi:hypothetical protein
MIWEEGEDIIYIHTFIHSFDIMLFKKKLGLVLLCQINFYHPCMLSRPSVTVFKMRMPLLST